MKSKGLAHKVKTVPELKSISQHVDAGQLNVPL